MLELIIIRGPPGSGKSARAKREHPEYLHYESDYLFCDTRSRYRFDAQLFEDAGQWVEKVSSPVLKRGACKLRSLAATARALRQAIKQAYGVRSQCRFATNHPITLAKLTQPAIEPRKRGNSCKTR